MGPSAWRKTKKCHMGKRGALGRRRDHRKQEERQQEERNGGEGGGRWEVGGEGRDPDPKEQGKIPCRSPPSPPTSPGVLNTAASQEAQNWKVSAYNLGRGPGSLLCLHCPMRGARAEVRRSSLMGGWRAGLVLNVHLAPQQRPPLHTIHKGTQTQLPLHGAAPSAAHSSHGAESRVKGCGGGAVHIHTYISIYNSDSLYKVREEKKGRGTLLGHHNRPRGLSPHPTGPQPAPGRLGWFTSHWSMCSWGWQNTESAADSQRPALPPWLHSGPPAARAGSSTLPWSTPPELC